MISNYLESVISKMMTRKDYITAADILNQAYPENPDLILEMAGDFSDYFAKDNPRFSCDTPDSGGPVSEMSDLRRFEKPPEMWCKSQK